MSDDMPKLSDLAASIAKFIKQGMYKPKVDGGQDSLPGISEPERKPLLPEIEDPALQVPDISSAIQLPKMDDPDVEYVSICAQCGEEFCSYPDRRWIIRRKR